MGEVCCEICAKKCHADHQISLVPNWSLIRFFCDCGSPNFTKSVCLCKPTAEDLHSRMPWSEEANETKPSMIIDQELIFKGSFLPFPPFFFSFFFFLPYIFWLTTILYHSQRYGITIKQ